MEICFPKKFIGITSPYGKRTSPYTGFHYGIDLGWNSKDGGKSAIIYSPCNGTVTFVKNNYNKTDSTGSSYGNYIIIKYDDNTEVLIAHLKYNSIVVKKGDKVKQLQKLGIIGNTGHSTGHHAHFEIRIKGKKVDPLKYAYVLSSQIVGEETAKKYKLLYKKEEDTKQMEELKKEIEALNTKNAELNNQIKELQSQLEKEKKYSFKFIAPKDNKYNIYLKEKEVLLIK